MTLEETIVQMGRKALVEEVMGVPLHSYKTADEWLEDAKEFAKNRLPDCLSWQSFCSLFETEIEDAFQTHRVYLDLFPGYSLDDMAEDLEQLSIRGK